MRCTTYLMVPALLLAGCATVTEPGWRGKAAKPFDGSRDFCEAQVQEIDDTVRRNVAFRDCMKSQGWEPGASD